MAASSLNEARPDGFLGLVFERPFLAFLLVAGLRGIGGSGSIARGDLRVDGGWERAGHGFISADREVGVAAS
jgi:hypothetical protein